MQNGDDGAGSRNMFQKSSLFAAGFIIGLMTFFIIISAARHGLAISSCAVSALETGASNLTKHAGTLHRISLNLFSFSITVQGRLPFIFEHKCDGKQNSSRPFINQERSSSKSMSGAKKNPAENQENLPDHNIPHSKASSPLEESQNRKLETNVADSRSSKWQWAYGAGVENFVSDVGSYSVKYMKAMYSEARDRNRKKMMQDRIWHYKYGSGQLDKSAILMNIKETCTESEHRQQNCKRS
jgi:hypothetical protein